jgi:hypothetical protein
VNRPPGQQAILDAIDTYGWVRVSADWRTGVRHVTTGRGHRFDARSFDALERRWLIVPHPEDAHCSLTQGRRYVRRRPKPA